MMEGNRGWGRVSVWHDEKSDAGENQSGDKQQWWLPNDVNTLNAAELHTRRVQMAHSRYTLSQYN